MTDKKINKSKLRLLLSGKIMKILHLNAWSKQILERRRVEAIKIKAMFTLDKWYVVVRQLKLGKKLGVLRWITYKCKTTT